MIVRFKPSALRQTRWYDYLVRFVLGGAMTVVALGNHLLPITGMPVFRAFLGSASAVIV